MPIWVAITIGFVGGVGCTYAFLLFLVLKDFLSGK